MRLPFDLIVFDLEANQPSGEIIEIGAVRVSRNFEIQDQFQSFVQPKYIISEQIAILCSLSDELIGEIHAAPPLVEVNEEFYRWATQSSKNVILASWGNYDCAELHSQDPTCQFRRKAIDIKSIAIWECARLGIKSTAGLSTLMSALGVEWVGQQHRAADDAYNTALLLCKLVDLNRQFKKQLLSLQESLAS